jgi:hypothetical protein
MPVSVFQDGQTKIVSTLTALNRLPDDADILDVSLRLLHGQRVEVSLRDGSRALMVMTPDQRSSRQSEPH